MSTSKESEELKQSLGDPEATMKELRCEIRASQAERTFIAAELQKAIMERNLARAELKTTQEELEAARSRQVEMQARLDELETVDKNLETERAVRMALEHSLTWRLTRPLRKLNRLLRRQTS